MTAFPDFLTSVAPANPLAESIEFRTLASEYESGLEVTKQKRLFARRHFDLKYQTITLAEAKTLWQFYLSRKGKHLPFNLFLPFANDYTGEYVGTGNATTVIYNLPCKTSSARAIYVANQLQTSGTDYTFSAATGEDGADKITFAVAPTLGQYITCDFTGRLKIRGKFAEDQMTFETFYNRLANTGLKIKGLLNA